MQKAISLQPQQRQQEAMLAEEMRGLLADYGALSLRREALRKAIPDCETRQRKLLNDTLAALGVNSYLRAAFDGRGNVLVEVPDEQPAADVPLVPIPEKPNGSVRAERK